VLSRPIEQVRDKSFIAGYSSPEPIVKRILRHKWGREEPT
jgi:hypothetical protein